MGYLGEKQLLLTNLIVTGKGTFFLKNKSQDNNNVNCDEVEMGVTKKHGLII